MNSVEKYKDYLIEAGFVNVVQVEYKWPIGPWPMEKDAKLLGKSCYKTHHEKVSTKLTGHLSHRILGPSKH